MGRRWSQLSPPRRTALISVFAAIFLVALKLVTGLVTGSLGFIAEAAHSGTDLVAALLTFFAVGVAGRPPDRDHPYGHGKAEHLSALAEAAFLVAVSLFIAYQALHRLIVSPGEHEVEAVWWAFLVIAVILVVDVSRAVLSWRASKAHGSAALAANAAHFASDFAGTFAVMIGLIGVSAGVDWADPVAALVVAVLVIAAGAQLMRTNVGVLMDRASANAEVLARASIAAAEPNAELRRLRLREAGGMHFVDATVAVAPDAAVAQGHAVADAIEEAIASVLPGSDVTVHIELRDTEDVRERGTAAAQSVRGVREIHNVRVVTVGDEVVLSLHAKLPAALALGEAHDAADAIEEAVRRAVPEAGRVVVHLEPLQAPASAAAVTRAEEDEHRADVVRIVRDVTGRAPLDVRFHREPRGLVAAVTVGLPATSTLEAAHLTAGRIEELVRGEHPDLCEVIVHTEPARGPEISGG